RESLSDTSTEKLWLAIAGQLENALADGDDAPLLVADDEPRSRGRVVVVEELEEEAEAAVGAAHGLVRQILPAVVVDRPPSAVRADEVRHVCERTTSCAESRAQLRAARAERPASAPRRAPPSSRSRPPLRPAGRRDPGHRRLRRHRGGWSPCPCPS